MRDRGGADVVGVVGAGTMGAGIAQLAALAGARTLLHDPDPARARARRAAIRANLAKGAERGRWTRGEAAARSARLEPVGTWRSSPPATS